MCTPFRNGLGIRFDDRVVAAVCKPETVFLKPMPRKCERDARAAAVARVIPVDSKVGKLTLAEAAADLRNDYSLNRTHGEGLDPGCPYQARVVSDGPVTRARRSALTEG
jgi:hypothetical protein